MKKLKIWSGFIVLAFATMFVSCENAPELGPEGSVDGPASFRVSYDNGVYTSDDAQLEESGGNITITGINSDSGQSVVMSFQGDGGGIYDDISATYMQGGTQYENTSPDNGNNYGTVVITAVDNVSHTVSGYFSFRVWSLEDPSAEPLVFFDGSFTNIPYTGELTATAPVTEDEYFKAKVDGGALTDFGTIITLPNSGMLQISGTNASTASGIQIILDENIAEGTYPISDNIDDVTAGYVTPTGGYVATDGSINIISNANGMIKATFHFNAADMDNNAVSITEGSFNVSY